MAGPTPIRLELCPPAPGAETDGLRAADVAQTPTLVKAMERFWASIQGRPVRYRGGGRLPPLRLNETGQMYSPGAQGLDDAMGCRVLCRFTFTRAGEVRVTAGANLEDLLGAVNDHAMREGLGFALWLP
jgi:hypothetical protein